MESEEIRKKFLEFFEKKGHVVVPSSSLLSDDPSVLLTTAGMQQFKKYFTGELNAVTVFEGDGEVPFDRESYDIWPKEIGINEARIRKCGRKDNFWGPTGNEGPCGPTTELYVDGIEVWNLVFNEYFCNKDKTL